MRPKTDKYIDGTKAMLRMFCTEGLFNPKKDVGRLNFQLYQHILNNVTGLVPDGEAAMQKIQRLLSVRFFPNNLICGWDEVHNVRALLKGAAKSHDMYLKIKVLVWKKPGAFGKC